MPRLFPSVLPALFVSLILAGMVISAWGAEEAQTGKALFTLNCAPCHGADGKAKTPMARKLGVKDLTVTEFTVERIRQQILDGVNKTNGAQVMPPFRGKLSEDEVERVIAFVKSLHVPAGG